MLRRRSGWLTLVLCAAPVVWCLAQTSGKPSKPRVKPPKFEEAQVESVFFSDVFSVVVGSRPDLQGTAPSSVAGSSTPGGSAAASPTATVAGWGKTISGTTVENEIKALKLLLDQDVTTPADFKGRGYKACRTHFSVAAMLFAIVNEYDGDIRWKADAAGARDTFARTAANAKVGTTQVFNEARQRKTELEDLIRGNAFPVKAQSPENDWPAICDRSPLMLRLDVAFHGEIKPATANAGEFKAKAEKLKHEAELLGAIAEVLCKSGMEDGDDDTYAGYAKEMLQGSHDILDALKTDDYDKARQAAGNIDKACNTCHEGYRG